MRFDTALQNPEQAQTAQIRSILKHAHGSIWARQHSIDQKTSLRDFRKRAPLMDGGSLCQWTDRMVKGEANVLTNSRVDRLVPTSGTTGPSKLIPMTPLSRREYSTAVNLWIHETLRSCPEIRNGRAYIATSPAQDFPLHESNIPVGFAEDSAYLGAIERMVLNKLLVVPMHVARLRGEAWRCATRDFLLNAKDLRFLSLWHPGYLGALFNEDELHSLHNKWPDLQLISCWSDGSCDAPSRQLHSLFPQTKHQTKGLWLTEGAVSIPWRNHHPVALLSGFFEFESENGEIKMVHQLEYGSTYGPIISNHSGLYRYKLGDLVEVDGFIGKTPSLQWIGRADHVVDLCGEKLSDAQIADALKHVAWSTPMVMVPSTETASTHYKCCVESGSPPFPVDKFEDALMRNPHYKWARSIGQLHPITVKSLPPQELRKLSDSKALHQKTSHLCSANNRSLFSASSETQPPLS